MTRTIQQQNFIQAVIAAALSGGGKNFALRARAGTGKTHTNMELIDDYAAQFPTHEITYCAFNSDNAKEGQEKLEKRGHKDGRKINSKTSHSLGLGLVRFAFKSEVNKFKVRDIIAQQNGEVYVEYTDAIDSLVNFAKLEGFGFFPDCQIGDVSAWYRIAEQYDINGFDDTSRLDDVIAAAIHVYKLSLAQTHIVDFNDMILFPLVKNLRVKFQKDLLIVDEAQDTGRAREALLAKFVKRDTGILVAVGDDKQGIYAFAGAQADALDKMIEHFAMEVFPLTICWRCSTAVIRAAQHIVPDIEAAPNAIEGSTIEGTIPEKPEPTDAILCRNNAPLIEQAYSLLRRGIACKVEGRDIGTGLIRMVNRWRRCTTIDQFLRKLDDYRVREVQKAQAKRNETKINEIEDRCATLVHLCNACLDKRQNTLEDLRNFINDIFADTKNMKDIVTLCSYHKAKGREWTRVFLFEHAKRCPSPWAKTPTQIAQESNLAYVATTRAMVDLVYVNPQGE